MKAISSIHQPTLFTHELRRQRGFTIVELLIVIVIIAILAAITIVAYSGIQNRAHGAATQADLHTIDESLKLYNTENSTLPVTLSDIQSSTMSTLLSRMTFTSYNYVPQYSKAYNYTGDPHTAKGTYNIRVSNMLCGDVSPYPTYTSYSIDYYDYQAGNWKNKGYALCGSSWLSDGTETTDDMDNPNRDGDQSHNVPCKQQYYEDCQPAYPSAE